MSDTAHFTLCHLCIPFKMCLDDYSFPARQKLPHYQKNIQTDGIHSIVKCGRSWKWGVKEKEKIPDLSYKIFRSSFLGRVRQIKTGTFSKQSQMAVRKDKTRPWLNFCVHQEPNPVESQHEVRKTTGKLAIQAACSSWDSVRA